jgi:uncharacterized surface protein with fasciclin (FAS1) repeats
MDNLSLILLNLNPGYAASQPPASVDPYWQNALTFDAHTPLTPKPADCGCLNGNKKPAPAPYPSAAPDYKAPAPPSGYKSPAPAPAPSSGYKAPVPVSAPISKGYGGNSSSPSMNSNSYRYASANPMSPSTQQNLNDSDNAVSLLALIAIMGNASNGAQGYAYNPTNYNGFASDAFANRLADALNRLLNEGSTSSLRYRYPSPYRNGSNHSGLSPQYGNYGNGMNGNSSGNTSWNQLRGVLTDLLRRVQGALGNAGPYRVTPNSLGYNQAYTTVTGQPFPPSKSVTSAVDLLSRSNMLPTLNNLIGRAGLGNTLADLEADGPVVIFAPTEAAFDKLARSNPALFQQLQKPENAHVLRQILTYHVSNAPGFGVPSNNLLIDSLNSNDQSRFTGNAFSGAIQNGNQTVRSGPVIQLPNGTLIVPINDVLLPPDFSPSSLH